MGLPILIDKIKFEDGIHAMAASLDGDKIAVGTKGSLGVYELKREGLKTGLNHLASFEIPGEERFAVTSVFFSADGKRLHVRSEDGYERELVFGEGESGKLIEVSCIPFEPNRTDYILSSRL